MPKRLVHFEQLYITQYPLVKLLIVEHRNVDSYLTALSWGIVFLPNDCWSPYPGLSFGNLNNLQFLSENGRVQKFANSFCSLAFMLQEFKEKSNNLFAQDDIEITVSSDRYTTGGEVLQKILSSKSSTPCLKNWQDYVSKLSAVLFAFLLSPEDAKVDKSQASTVKSSLPVSSAYGELSVKWIIRVLLTVFPCIKACSNQKELPGHLR